MNILELKENIINIIKKLGASSNLVDNKIFNVFIKSEILSIINDTISTPNNTDEVTIDDNCFFFSRKQISNNPRTTSERKSFFELSVVDENNLLIRHYIYKYGINGTVMSTTEAKEIKISLKDDNLTCKENYSYADNRFDSKEFTYDYSIGHQRITEYSFNTISNELIKMNQEYNATDYKKSIYKLTFNDLLFHKFAPKENHAYKVLK